MVDGADRHQHLFIVRLWQEPGRQGSGQWRGSVEHVPSGLRLYYSALADLTDFITLRLAVAAPAETVQSEEERLRG
jgi:hypothetical protein